jgi:type VI secretion system secreted protein VgrG
MAAVEVDKFIKHLRDNADDKSFGHGRCAYFVRQALAAGGYKPATWPIHAKDWGPSLLRAGFHTANAEDLSTYKPMKGDIAVIQATSHRKSGHPGV